MYFINAMKIKKINENSFMNELSKLVNQQSSYILASDLMIEKMKKIQQTLNLFDKVTEKEIVRSIQEYGFLPVISYTELSLEEQMVIYDKIIPMMFLIITEQEFSQLEVLTFEQGLETIARYWPNLLEQNYLIFYTKENIYTNDNCKKNYYLRKLIRNFQI